MEPHEPKYRWGQTVTAAEDLFNDGTYPEREAEALLVARGAVGEIVQVGHHVEANVPVYLVEFPDGVVGCIEEEIVPAWGP
jgi:nitrogen fixation protein NifZ